MRKILIREVLEGKKPLINSDENGAGENGWLLLMLSKMHAELLIPENAEEYVRFGDFIPEGLTGYNPVTNRVVDSTIETKNAIRELNLENVRVLGNLIRVGLFNAEKWQKIGENADVFILPNKGDLY